MTSQIKKFNNCPACHGKDIVQGAFLLHDFPAIIFPVEFENKNKIDSSKLSIAKCNHCNHMFIDELDIEFNKAIYTRYYYLYPFSNLESMNQQYRKPFHEVFDFVDEMMGANEKELLEIGCSDATQFEHFINKNIQCTGISPGAHPSEKLEMIDSFYEDKKFTNHFNFIISRFNLEHILDLDEHLIKIHTELALNGRVIIQVPNVQHLMKSGVLNVFAHEHTQYFNPVSLKLFLERHNFVIELMRGQDEASLIAVAKKIEMEHEPLEVIKRQKANIETVYEIIESHKSNNFLFYGAGLSLSAILYNQGNKTMPWDRIKLVDDNPILTGRVMPATNTPIQKFSSDLIDKKTIIFILLNEIYHSRILSKLELSDAEKVYALTHKGLEKLER